MLIIILYYVTLDKPVRVETLDVGLLVNDKCYSHFLRHRKH